MREVQVTHSVFASLAHRYWNTAWTADQNAEAYGRDASEEGIGSNLRIDLSTLSKDEKTIATDLAKLKVQVDHQCLFCEHATSLEQITADLAATLSTWSELCVWENEHLSCAVRPEGQMRLKVRIDNLTLEIEGPRDPRSGLIARRADLNEAVASARAEFINQNAMEIGAWSEKLFNSFKTRLKNLKSLRVDLGSHEYLYLRA